MPVSPEFRDHVLEMLEPLGPVIAKSMFGGVGLYLEGTMFALITRSDVLYMRTDDGNRGEFEAAGMGPFVPFEDGRMVMPYHEVPPDLLGDADRLGARNRPQAAGRAARRRPNLLKGPERPHAQCACGCSRPCEPSMIRPGRRNTLARVRKNRTSSLLTYSERCRWASRMRA